LGRESWKPEISGSYRTDPHLKGVISAFLAVWKTALRRSKHLHRLVSEANGEVHESRTGGKKATRDDLEALAASVPMKRGSGSLTTPRLSWAPETNT